MQVYIHSPEKVLLVSHLPSRLLGKGNTVKIIEKSHKAGTMTSRLWIHSPLLCSFSLKGLEYSEPRKTSSISPNLRSNRTSFIWDLKSWWKRISGLGFMTCVDWVSPRNVNHLILRGTSPWVENHFRSTKDCILHILNCSNFRNSDARANLSFFPNESSLQQFKATLDDNHVENQVVRSMEELDPTMVNSYNLERFQELKYKILGNIERLPFA